MSEYTTVFGSLAHYEKGRVEIIQDKARHYAFSNIFEVASQAQPYEKTAVAKNLEYVVEVLRAEGRSDWFTAAHDEFAVVMDGHSRATSGQTRRRRTAVVSADTQGSVRLPGPPTGKKMGLDETPTRTSGPAPSRVRPISLWPNSRVLFCCKRCKGPLTLEKWADICAA